METLDQVAALRSQLWDAGFRPVPVLTADKRPIGNAWGERARQNPPECIRFAPVPHATNTGILCDGLRAIDIDIDDPTLAKRCRAIIVHRHGEAPIRIRANSPRCLILYRAAEGIPDKLTLAGDLGKIEALGRGQQFVAFGRHPSGADLEWFPDAPGQEALAALPAITEHDLLETLNELAPVIEAQPIVRPNGHDRVPGDPQADPLRVAVALHAIPNNGPADWEAWNRVGMAVWRATGGSALGLDAFAAWSARHPSYDAAETAARWKHYADSPPTSIGAGTLFYMARGTADVPEGLGEPVEAPPDLSDEEWLSISAQAGHDLNQRPEPAPGEIFEASPLDWDAMLAVPPREWVYSHFLIRRFISVLGAPGGTGKTAYAFAVALSIVTGADFLCEPVHEPGNVWIYNLEDPKDELLRRMHATLRRYGVTRKDVEDRMFLDSGRDRPLVIAKATSDGGMVVSPIVKQVIAEIKRRNIRVMIVDPFVRSHRLQENINEQIDFAAALWGEVADQADCAILLLHHFRKGGLSGDASAFRGASALIDAARAALSLSPMSEDEARRLGVPEDDRWQFVRVDNAKLNLAPPPAAATWLKLVGEDLGNATRSRPSDRVQAVERWEPPSAWDGLPWSMVHRVLDKIEAGCGEDEFYSLAPQAKERWAGTVLMDDAGKTAAQAKAILKAWIANGVLEEGQYMSYKRKQTTGCVRVNPAKVQEMRLAMAPARDDADA